MASTFADVVWAPGVSKLFGVDTVHQLLLTECNTTRQVYFEYVAPLFIPQAIGLELTQPIDQGFVENVLFRRRATFLDAMASPSPSDMSFERHEVAATTATTTTATTTTSSSLNNIPMGLFSKEPVHLDVEEDVYVSQSILLSLLLSPSANISDDHRPILQDTFVSHTKLMLEALVHRIATSKDDAQSTLDSLSHLVYASLYGGLVALLQHGAASNVR
ncbi:hypothetical protein AaE_009776 [Aphanomyces astaci]|uniref:Uncharacterized protein n=1 Tax=Aphanomyces astaci TaxID=112090 RepID=A0A6A5A429_APHAT|nr:hypothetical protein AaE_009776 [Aphanomyces astaci]